MTKQDVVDMIERQIKTENRNYERYTINNPTDKQRKHDHEVIMSVYEMMLSDLNTLFK